MANKKSTYKVYCSACSTFIPKQTGQKTSDYKKRMFCSTCLKEKQIAFGKKAIWTRKGMIDPTIASVRRYKQLKYEEEQANSLVNKGFEVFSPTVVCDRIAVKDGKVYFVEFKKSGQKLRPGQQRIHDLVPNNYIIEYNSK